MLKTLKMSPKWRWRNFAKSGRTVKEQQSKIIQPERKWQDFDL